MPALAAEPDAPPLLAEDGLPQVGAIVTDEEFQRRIPDLQTRDEDDPTSPLGTLEDFERSLDEQQAIAEPAQDAELEAPLAPLDVFAGQPLLAGADAASADSKEIAYAWELRGLEAADELAPADLQDLFSDLSALRRGKGKAEGLAQVSARMREDALLAERLLASQGWFEARVTTRLAPADAAQGRPATAILEVDPGQRYVLAQIIVQAPATEPEGLIADAMALTSGEPILATRIEAAEARVALMLPRQGYPFVEVGQRDIELDPDSGGGIYTLPVDTGPRSRFGEIRTSGKLAFDARHIAVISRFRPGDPYDSRLVDDLRQALVATGLLATVAVKPERTGEPAGDGTQYAAIAVEQQAGPPRTIAGSAGYGTGQGPRAEVSWTHRNLFPPEGALIASLVAGTQEQGLSATFRRANAGQRDRVFLAAAELSRRDYDAYEATTGRLSALMSRESTSIWHKRLTWAVGAQILATNEQIFDPRRIAQVRRTYLVGGLTGQVGIDRTDSLLDPTRGFRLGAVIEPEGSLQGGFTPYIRARFDGSAYVRPAGGWVLAGRARLGTIQGISRGALAPSRRFYSGGGGSVRGYGYQAIGPQVTLANPDFDPANPDDKDNPFIYRAIGARSLAEAAVEVRYRFGDYGVAAFVDGGQAYESSLPRLSGWRFGAGIGGRFYTNFGPLRLDLATPLNPRDGDGRLTVLVSIGQAF